VPQVVNTNGSFIVQSVYGGEGFDDYFQSSLNKGVYWALKLVSRSASQGHVAGSFLSGSEQANKFISNLWSVFRLSRIETI